MKQPYDRSSKWLIQHHGDSILRLAGVTNVAEWSAVQPELVQPRRLPDGLLEVRFEGATETVPYLIEIDTRPDRRLASKMPMNAMLVYLDREQWPEAITVVLVQRGDVPLDARHTIFSSSGRARNESS